MKDAILSTLELQPFSENAKKKLAPCRMRLVAESSNIHSKQLNSPVRM